jgi:hypothetical protein
MTSPLHLLKLCVGCDDVDELVAWREAGRREGRPWILRTRQTPRQDQRLLAGGSLYRVFRGMILSRQRILAVTSVGEGPERRCEIELDETLVRVAPTPRRAFQGWRYLEAAEAPPDLPDGVSADDLPPDLARRLREAGAW